ncbi:nitrogen regulatory protein P-II [Streptococcus sp. C150]|nr:nitrogen regulatory protein P-II [Streptococcus sp. C150]
MSVTVMKLLVLMIVNTRKQLIQPLWVWIRRRILMKKIEAIIRSDKLEDLKNALTGSGLAKGMTVSQVLGYGTQRGFAEFVRGQRIVPTLLAKVKVEIVVKDLAVDEVVDAIRGAVATGEVGDGKIFIVPIDDVIRIRTGERGGDAI